MNSSDDEQDRKRKRETADFQQAQQQGQSAEEGCIVSCFVSCQLAYLLTFTCACALIHALLAQTHTHTHTQERRTILDKMQPLREEEEVGEEDQKEVSV